MCRGSNCKNAPDSDAGGCQDGGGGGGGASGDGSGGGEGGGALPPSPTQSQVPVLFAASTTDEVQSDLWGSNGDSSAEFSGEESGDKENIMALINEFDQENSIIMQKIKILSQKYKYFRPIARDGNCFYRAFIFNYLEHVLEIEDESERRNEVTHLRQCVEKAKQAYESLGPPWISHTSFLERFNAFWSFISKNAFGQLILKENGFVVVNEVQIADMQALEYLFNLIEVGLSPEQLYLVDKEDAIVSNILRSIRLLTEIELCAQEEFYYPFLCSLDEYESVYGFCQHEVGPMGEEANHLQITALVNALGIPLIVENLDTSLSHGCVRVTGLTFCPRMDPEISQVFANSGEPTEERTFANLSPVERRRLVTLLYRPGHYDVLYPMLDEETLCEVPHSH